MIVRFFAILLGVLGIGSASQAATASAIPTPSDGPYVRARLVAEHLNLTPGKRAWLALEFAIAPGWHMYWKGQNDTGMPPMLDITLPPDFKVGEILWPAPERHIAPGDLLDSIVHEQMTLLISVDVPVNAKPGTTARIALKAEWLVCQEACVLEDASLELTLPIRDTTPAAEVDSKNAGIFAAARERLPRKLPKENAPATIEWKDQTVVINAPGATTLTFHAEEDGIALESPLTEASAKAARLQFRLKPASKPEQRLLGVLEVRKEGKKPEFYSVSLPQPAPSRAG